MKAQLVRLVVLAVTLLLTGCPGSRLYRPSDASEQQLFSSARRDIFPEDVRADVLRYRTQMLLWSGIIREVRPVETGQGPGMEVLFEHHYWDFIEDYSVQKARAFLSPRGEGMFQASFPEQHAQLPEHVRVDDMAIVYGTPERLDADGRTVVLTGVRFKTFPKGLYATDIWDYGRDFLVKGDRNDFRVLRVPLR
jgi:hypothetical protein